MSDIDAKLMVIVDHKEQLIVPHSPYGMPLCAIPRGAEYKIYLCTSQNVPHGLYCSVIVKVDGTIVINDPAHTSMPKNSFVFVIQRKPADTFEDVSVTYSIFDKNHELLDANTRVVRIAATL